MRGGVGLGPDDCGAKRNRLARLLGTTPLFRALCLLVLIFAWGTGFAWGGEGSQANQKEAPPTAASRELPSAPPAIGQINGVKISIPRYYLTPGLEYEGENFWEGKRRTFTPTFDSPIKDFGIRLRVSNLEPIRTQQDEADYINFGHTPETRYKNSSEMWMLVAVYADRYRSNWLQGLRNSYDADDATNRRIGPFTRQPELEFGLAHSVSPHPVDDGVPQHSGWGQDFYYDETSKATLILCQTSRMVVEPYLILTSCSHFFILPELKAVAEAIYTKNDLHRWREIEGHLKSIFHSFIANPQ
jgi:hypothetical protein